MYDRFILLTHLNRLIENRLFQAYATSVSFAVVILNDDNY